MAEAPTIPAADKPKVAPVNFVHLHCHTVYSALDGASKPSLIPARLDELGMDTMAATDHGNVQCWPEFEKYMKKAGKKAIFGCEVYFTDDRFDKRKETTTHHLTLIAENDEGLANLIKISTYAFTEGLGLLFGRPRPRADWELLEKYSAGVVAFTGCMAGPVMSRIFKGDLVGAKENTKRLLGIMGPDNIFGEIQNVGIVEQIPAYSELAYKLGRQGEGMPESYDPQQRHDWEQQLALVSQRQIDTDPELSRVSGIMTRTSPLSQNESNQELAEICAELDIPLVATGDLHYLREGDAFNHDAMICLGTGQIPQRRPDRKFSLLPQRYHMRSEAEMKEALGQWPEALANTRKIADRCNASIKYNKELLPKFPLPEQYLTHTEEQKEDLFEFLKHGAIIGGLDKADEYEIKERNVGSALFLRDLARDGLVERMRATGTMIDKYEEAPQEYRERLEFELAVMHKMGYDDYFLITWDLLNFAHTSKIPAGPGRGSAAGSLVSYCLEITQLDPLTYGLLFERFLNPDRVSSPDVDLDFSQEHLERMRQYARNKYNPLAGSDTGVAQIITFSTFKAKNSLKDSARVLGEPTDEGRQAAIQLGNRLSNIVPTRPPNITLEKVWKDESGLKAAYHSDPAAAEAIKLAGWLEGMVKTYGQHAAAVIIGDHPLEDDVPLQIQVRKEERILTTQWEMNACEQIGLLKMDFLGLRNLDIIDATLEKIRYSRGVDLGNLKQLYTTLKLDDPETYELYQHGETVGTFQFESGGMRSALHEVRPTEFNDLIALVALYRPGPMQNIPVYAARKAGREQVSYPDQRIEEVLGETYGVTVYQEQSMLISQILANFTKGQADELRKAIGKKLADKMEALKIPFIEGCVANGVSSKIANELWLDNERSAEYSFNKSHAACYAFVAYCTGYLKTHYPEEYMASLLSSVMGDSDRMRPYLSEAKRMGIRVLPPDVNRSLRDFSVYPREGREGEYEILFGLNALKGVGEKVVDILKEEREARGPFTSIYDLIRRLHDMLDIKSIQALVKAGALDSTGATRKAMFDVVEATMKDMKKAIKDREKDFLKEVGTRAIDAGPLGGGQLLLEPIGKRMKLGKLQKVVLDALGSACWAERTMLNENELVACAEAALLKEELRVARAEAKKTIQEDAAHSTSIADEEGEVQDLKTLVEEAAGRTVAGTRDARIARARELALACQQFVTAELNARNEQTGLEEAMANAAAADPSLEGGEWPHVEKLNLERDILGIYVSGHPLDHDSKKWARYVNVGLGQIDDSHLAKGRDDTRRVVGAVVAMEQFKSKKGWRVTIEDLTGAREITLFNSSIEGKEELLQLGSILVVEIKVEVDSFAQSRAAESAELEGGEDGVEVEAQEIPVQCKGITLYAWNPDQIKNSELRSQEEAEAQLPTVSDKLLVDAEVAVPIPSSSGVDLAPALADAAANVTEEENRPSELPSASMAPPRENEPAGLSVVETEAQIELESAEVAQESEETGATQVSAESAGIKGDDGMPVETEEALAAAKSETPSPAAPASGSGNGNGNGPDVIRIKIDPERFSPELRERLKAAFDSSPGTTPVKIVIGDKTFGGISVTPTKDLKQAVQDILHAAPAPTA